MYKAARLVLENIISGNLDKKTGAEILSALKTGESKENSDIAVIGMSVRLPGANNTSEFWENLKQGKECISELSELRRQDSDRFLRVAYPEKKDAEYIQGGYLAEIDKFDNALFRLSPAEASLMDPNQRLFLEVAWEALEDAGYGGRKLSGSETGIYLGYNGWSLYGQMISMVDPSLTGASRTGNISSIIASRLAYLLDLKGPSLLVDTACSSSLVALHLACQALRNGECSAAIAGGVKINLFPLKDNASLGIESADYKTKAFDEGSDGTVWGEGSVAVLLKRLDKALAEEDNIYAVIKGSAVNQDGSSAGITAPNVTAQERVIVKAWENAGVDPETIAYIETHGTGTKLGDPIEIEGIKRAFGHYTTKKQFCGIGSLKTNIGHLDNTSGIANVIKAILILKHGEVPPTLNFSRPNRKINLEDTPVYVNDSLRKLEEGNAPLRCGVSAFGLSGTNCHVVLEKFDQGETNRELQANGKEMLTFSAMSEKALQEIVENHAAYLKKNPQLLLKDICFTSNDGRGQYEFRLALLIKDREELEKKLALLSKSGISALEAEGVYYGRHRIVTKDKKIREAGELIEEEKRRLNQEADLILQTLELAEKNERDELLRELCKLYTAGADIPWNRFYSKDERRRVSLPTYPFNRKRCWIEMEIAEHSNQKNKEILQPLIDRQLAETYQEEIYACELSADRQWVLREHKIFGNSTLPGTAYLEMVREACDIKNEKKPLELRDVLFLSPLVVNDGETREAQIILKKDDGHVNFTVASKYKDADGNELWLRHAEGKTGEIPEESRKRQSIEEIIQRCEKKDVDAVERVHSGSIEFGPRWTNIRLKELFVGQNEFLMKLDFPEEFAGDLENFVFHPSFMDVAITTSGPFAGEGLHLPLSYKKLKIYGTTVRSIYSHIRKCEDMLENSETRTFDVTIMDGEGSVIVDVSGFTLKKVHKRELKVNGLSSRAGLYHELHWVEKADATPSDYQKNGCVLILKDRKGMWKDIARQFEGKGNPVIYAEAGQKHANAGDSTFLLGGKEEDYDRIFEALGEKELSYIIHMLSLDGSEDVDNLQALEDNQEQGVMSLFHMVRSMLKNKVKGEPEIFIVTMNNEEVTGGERFLNPHNASVSGMGKVVGQEYPQFKCRSIDIDEAATAEDISREILSEEELYKVAYRAGKRYVEEFDEANMETAEDRKIDLKSEGVYLITGGTGGIGLELGKYLASLEKINLCLVSRTGMPSRDDWESITAKGENKKLCKTIDEIKSMESTGTQVVICKADVSKPEDMEILVDSLRREYGRVNGVIHSAGVAGDGFIIRKDRDTFRNVLLPKVSGTWLLDRLTRVDNPDFFVMCSSLTAVFGGAGQTDYAAANAYMDAYAAYRSRMGLRTLAINWPAWKEIGMAVDHGTNTDGRFKALPTAQAIEAFDKVFGKAQNRIVIGEVNYKGIASLEGKSLVKMSQRITAALEKARQNSETAASGRNEKHKMEVVLKGRVKRDYTETEIALANIWGEVLGVNELDIYDSFYDMGGDSILATRLLKIINSVYPGTVDIADVFSYPSVNRMAEFIDLKRGKKTAAKEQQIDKKDELDDILLRLEKGELSVEEVEKMMK